MVHSFEIQYPLSRAAITYCMLRLGIDIGNTEDADVFQDDMTVSEESESFFFFRRPLKRNYRVLIDRKIGNHNSGLIYIMFVHRFINKKYDEFYIRFRIDPTVLLTQEESKNLFYCIPENIEALQEAYAKLIKNLFPAAYINPSPLRDGDFRDEFERCSNKTVDLKKYLKKIWMLSALPYLGLGTVKRIDYAMVLKTPEHSTQFLTLAKRSVLDRRKKQVATFKGVEYANQSRIFGVYTRNEEGEKSDDTITFRTIIRNPSKEWKQRYLHMPFVSNNNLYSRAGGGLFPFLNEEVAGKLLNEEYNKLIGPGDFYSTYKAWKIIDQSKYKKDKKQSLKDIMYLASRCWSLQKAEERYISGKPFSGNHKTIMGTKQTFRRSVKQLRELGIQPLRIPANWHLSYLHNPIEDDVSRKVIFEPEPLNQLLSKETLKKYEDTKTEIKEMLEARRIK